MSERLLVATMLPTYEHSHTAEESLAFPADAENLVFALADELRRGELPSSRDSTAGEVEALEERYGLRDVLRRLGARAPDIGPAEHAALARAFADRYEGLPVSHARYEHAHDGHGHEAHGCGKIHGPLRRRLDSLEGKVLGRISGRRAQAALATAAFRLGALTFCPGDDILAVGAQAYGAVSGHLDHGDQHEEFAVLPRRPRIDFELEEGRRKAKVLLPLDAPAAHSDLPGTRAGDILRAHVADDGPRQEATRSARLAEEAAARPEKRRRRRRVLALGALAMAALGVGAGDMAHQTAVAKPAIVTPPAAPGKTEARPRQAAEELSLTQPVKITKGDSQWEIVSGRVEEAVGSDDVSLVNAATAYTAAINAEAYPDPDVIAPGNTLQAPAPATLKRFAAALDYPEKTPGLARALWRLNAQDTYGDPESKRIAHHITLLLKSQEKQ